MEQVTQHGIYTALEPFSCKMLSAGLN